jgi:phenylalanyl-tRNA synthetase alpha subunit
MILDKIDQLLKEVQTLSAQNAEEVEQLRLKYLSKKGEITALMNDFREVAADQKKTVGMKINELKTLATERINQLRENCSTQEGDSEGIDLTRTPYPIQLGTRHPLTIVTNEIIDIFSRMGFVLADGPEVEDDLHVFTKMNFARGRRPACVHQDELCRRSPRSRYAGHVLCQPASQRCHQEHPVAFAHVERTSPRDGKYAHRGR